MIENGGPCNIEMSSFMVDHLNIWKSLEDLMQNGLCLVDFVRLNGI